ncbi:lipopolysaccharide biosynthesis protein [Pontibacter flavimaris]|uniref:Lipopolysaccharide biosynthesis protein n=1 Tax=Pontibacter flavimaris TaxID=1797110 RepID=A0A1Q5PAC6_9BACT|nr:hypothetical protein [Pontibacter flavimaris]OKL39154.1 hypothetical protein A3841_04200 [Pontibacter flavimaris]
MLRKLLSHAAIYGLAAQLPRVAGVLALPIITPFLTTTDYGVAGVVTAYVTALGMVQSLGLSVVMVNAYVKHPTRYKWVWRQLHGFISMWSVVYGIVLAAVLYLFIPAEAVEDRWSIIVLHSIPAMFLYQSSHIGSLYYQMQQKPSIVATQGLAVGLITISLNIYFIAYLQVGYMGWFYSTFTGAVVGFILIVYPLYVQEGLLPIMRFKWYRIREALRVSIPVIPHKFSFFLLDTSDKLVMDILQVPMPRIGFYNIASSFGLYFASASNAIVQAANPLYVQLYAASSGKKAALYSIRHATFSLQAVFFAITSLACIWMKEIFFILIKNNDLRQAYPLAIVILMGYNYRPMYLALINKLTYGEKTAGLWKISIVASLGNVGLNFILVPLFGIEAAAYTTFVALMYMGYSGYFFADYRNSASLNYYPLQWLTINIALLGLVYWSMDMVFLAKATISLLLIVAALVSLFYINKRHEMVQQL